MIWFLIVPVAFYYGCKEVWDDARGFMDYFMGLMLGACVAFLAAVPAVGLAFLLGLMFESHAVKTGQSNLAAIRDKDSVSGQFFLGSGSIEGSPYYFYYRLGKDGGLRPGKVKASSGVVVYEERRADAILITYRFELDQPWAWIIAAPVSAGGSSYEFRVPEGTVRRGYSM